MTARNWDRQRERSRIARHGAEPVAGLLPSAPPRIRPSKSAMRDEATAAVSAAGSVTKEIVCACGHRGTVRVTPAQAERGRFRCKCGRLTT